MSGFRQGRRLGLGLVLWLVLALPATAWGPLGHRTVAVLAEANLTPAARAYVVQRLGNVSMADVASWADSVTRDSRFPGSLWYHFEKIPDGRGYLDNLRTMPEAQRRKGGVVAAILVAERTLRDDRASAAAQRNALKFLIHFGLFADLCGLGSGPGTGFVQWQRGRTRFAPARKTVT